MRARLLGCCAVGVMILLVWSFRAAADGFTVADLGTLGGSSSFAFGINAGGEVTGTSNTTADATVPAFLNSGGTMMDLGTLGESGSEGLGINDSGEVVGGFTAGNARDAFLYSGGVMTDIAPAGWTDTRAAGIDDNGEVVGFGTNPAGQEHGFLLTPVSTPEPSSLLLLAMGLVGWIGLARKKFFSRGTAG